MARATWELAAAMAGQGHAVHAITRSPEASAVEIPGVEVHAVTAPRPAGDAPVLEHLAHAAAVHRAIAEIHARSPVDAVLAPLWGCEGIVSVLDERWPTVMSCMTSMTTIVELGSSVGRLESEQLIRLERATMARTAYLHGLTRGTLEKTIADYGADPAETAIVARGIADRAGSPPARDRGSEPPRILFVGRLELRKGVDVLLEAAARLAADGVPFSLLLAGPDSHDTETGEPYRAAFERGPGREPPLAGRVRFAGAVDDDELDRLYRDADVVCVPSRYESHGVVLVEAMMFGRPIVACAAGGVPEVVESEGNALLAEPGDAGSLATALGRVVGDPELRRRLGARSRALYEERFEAGAVGAAMARFLARVSAAHRTAETTPQELAGRLAEVVAEVLPREAASAERTAAELLDPPPEAWRAAALDAERERSAWHARAAEAERQVGEWQARALEAERQRAEAEGALASVSGSRWWRLTRPLRRVTYALRRR